MDKTTIKLQPIRNETNIQSHPHPRRDAHDGADGMGDRPGDEDVCLQYKVNRK